MATATAVGSTLEVGVDTATASGGTTAGNDRPRCKRHSWPGGSPASSSGAGFDLPETCNYTFERLTFILTVGALSPLSLGVTRASLSGGCLSPSQEVPPLGRSLGTPLMRGREQGSRTFFAQPQGGGEPFSPDDIAGLEGWYKADAIAEAFPIIVDGNDLSEWPDSSGNARTLEQDTVASRRPTYKTNILNGKAVARFATGGDPVNTGDWMSSEALGAVFTAADPLTFFQVIKSTDQGVPFVMTNGIEIIGAYTYDDSGQVLGFEFVGDPAQVFIEGPGPALEAWGIVVATWTGTDAAVYVDGVLIGSGTDDQAVGSPLTFYLGGDPISVPTLPEQYHNGDMAEVLIYSAALSDEDLNLVGNYLADKYALTWTDI